MNNGPALFAWDEDCSEELTSEEQSLAQLIVEHVLGFGYVDSIDRITKLRIKKSAINGELYCYPHVYVNHSSTSTGLVLLKTELIDNAWSISQFDIPAD